MNGKLTDIDEGMLVRDVCVHSIHLCQCALHEVDHGQDIGRGESGILHKRNVHLLRRKEDTTTSKIKNIISLTFSAHVCPNQG